MGVHENADDFDKDITSDPLADEVIHNNASFFIHMHGHFLMLLDAGFTETQALRYLAFLSLHRGDDDDD